MNEQTEKAPPLICRSRVKKYALKVSKERRAGKFTRVSEDFLRSVEIDLDSAIRQLVIADLSEVPSLPDDKALVTGEALRKASLRLNTLAQLIIYRKVHRHPTLGSTLK